MASPGASCGRDCWRTRSPWRRRCASPAWTLARASACPPTCGVFREIRAAELMARCLRGQAWPRNRETFRAAWQDRVQRLLLQHADDPDVIVLAREPEAAQAGALEGRS